MLLPQSSAFAALKNRLNSVSAIGLLHTPASMPLSSGPRPSVVAGMSSATLPSSTSTGTVPGRLNRTSREIGTSSDVKWPELVEKFRGTQEKARRRNERALRGEDQNDLGGGPATRSLLELDTRSSVTRNGKRSIEELRAARPGSGLGMGKPLPNRPDSAQDSRMPIRSGAQGSNLERVGGPAGGYVGLGGEKGHKSRHSLAGFGKMMGRGGSGSREEKGKKDDAKGGGIGRK